MRLPAVCFCRFDDGKPNCACFCAHWACANLTTDSAQVQAEKESVDLAPLVEHWRVRTDYDHYPQSADSPWQTPDRPYQWPTMDQLLASQPFGEQGPQIFGDPLGQVTQIVANDSAERFYFDHRGRMICRVVLIKGMLQPQIQWFQYNFNDQVTHFVYPAANLAFGYQYDAWQRLTRVFDLDPASARMRIYTSFQRSIAGTADAPAQETQTLLGPLLDESGEANPFMAPVARELAFFQHTPTGEIAHATYGHGTHTVKAKYLFDTRAWLLGSRADVGDTRVFQADLDYFGQNNGAFANTDPATKMYDGNISRIQEQFPHLKTLMSDGSYSGEVDRMTHQYSYDLTYQLTNVAVDRGSQGLPTTQSYRYDANGNRLSETRNNQIQPDQSSTYSTTLTHNITPGTNQLANMIQTAGSGGAYSQVALQYQADGNTRLLTKTRVADNQQLQQRFYYEDSRFPSTPTRIEQTPNDSNYVQAQMAYDHNGARIKRQTTTRDETNQQVTKVRYYLPQGNDNLAEFDDYGRLTRGYLSRARSASAPKAKRRFSTSKTTSAAPK